MTFAHRSLANCCKDDILSTPPLILLDPAPSNRSTVFLKRRRGGWEGGMYMWPYSTHDFCNIFMISFGFQKSCHLAFVKRSKNTTKIFVTIIKECLQKVVTSECLVGLGLMQFILLRVKIKIWRANSISGICPCYSLGSLRWGRC